MKALLHAAQSIALASLFLTSSGFATTGSAQTPAPHPAATPSTSSTSAGQAGADAAQNRDNAQTQAGPVGRERRAQAYAKLLEGQRYMTALRSGISPTLVQLARQSFQQAAAFDPSLAEAHTALSELAFFFPPQDFALAEREATTATRINRNNVGAHRMLSRIYAINSGLRDNNVKSAVAEKAIAELREVARLDPTDAEAWALLGEFYFAQGKRDEAIEAWTRLLAAAPPSDPRIFQFITNGRDLSPDAANARLGEALIAAGRTAEAVAAIRRAIALNPENREYTELLGQAFESGGNDTASIAELQRMVAQDPSNTDTLRLLARVQARAGRVDDAAATLNAAINQRPKGDRDRLLLRLSLAQIYTDALRYAEAVAVYEDLLKERNVGNTLIASDDDKEFASVLLRRINNLYKSAGRMEDVAATIERMRRLLGPADSTADEEYIDLLRNQGKREEALSVVRSARLRYPEQTDLLYQEAATLTDLGRVDQAITLLRATLKGSVEDFDTYRVMSALYTQARRGREAVEAARKMLDLSPVERQDLMAAALITLSSAQERAGDPKGAEDSLRRILAREPNHPTALNNLGYFLLERNERLSEALDMIQRAVRAEPTNSSFLDSLGWAYFKLGQLEEAERHLSEAARRDSTSATIQDHLGDLYQKRGKPEQARAAWQKALSLSVEAGEIARIKAKLSNQTGK